MAGVASCCAQMGETGPLCRESAGEMECLSWRGGSMLALVGRWREAPPLAFLGGHKGVVTVALARWWLANLTDRVRRRLRSGTLTARSEVPGLVHPVIAACAARGSCSRNAALSQFESDVSGMRSSEDRRAFPTACSAGLPGTDR